MAAWTASAIVAAAPAAAPFDGDAVLTVSAHVTDYANVPREELAGAQAHATAAYRAAGLALTWSSTPWRPEPSRSTDSNWIDVRVVILSRDMTDKLCRERRFSDEVLGHALSAATGASGRIAYILYHRITRLAASHNTVQQGLGHVMAHEIGHLLLGVSRHADEGLMREEWRPWDGRVHTFTRRQEQEIRRRFPLP